MRDFLLGREIKDIDFFMRSRGPEEDKRIAEAVFDDAVLMGQGIPKEYRMQMPELAGVYMSRKVLAIRVTSSVLAASQLRWSSSTVLMLLL
jgi:hypothetical protein